MMPERTRGPPYRGRSNKENPDAVIDVHRDAVPEEEYLEEVEGKSVFRYNWWWSSESEYGNYQAVCGRA